MVYMPCHFADTVAGTAAVDIVVALVDTVVVPVVDTVVVSVAAVPVDCTLVDFCPLLYPPSKPI